MIETAHLKKGSPKPATKPGVLRLYAMRFCPFAQRAMLVLHTKKIPHEQVNINLKEKPEWLFDLHPLGKVPSIEIDGNILFESLFVADYLDEQYPQVPLYPKDPMAKTKDRLLIDSFDKIQISVMMLFFYENKINATAFGEALSKLDFYEKELATRGTPFYGGATPSMVDLMMWPMWERFGLMAHYDGDQYVLPAARFPKLTAWIERMKVADGVKEVFLPTAVHAEYFGASRKGPDHPPNFDILVKA